ncbi:MULTISPECIES: SDR family NAD(P)-dependent oxidoreductase [unclassified Pseudofrankia]|uniref:SDR family NAD(P)-dependent oxidoreductase n=1 Tax=unclassified Pseudofrankia TaxID=2994372 RepID=UPI0008D8F2D2|nr:MULTISPECIES: SDR family oxidoreductase [unclassified Pseudofrankia]MDT3444670.1 SDR family oxidoreductase [Pseudofrankia sp. BMG5.37]OHV66587.1 oxidoreductase [Pseudofrankia sp. BMG5.36]
MQHPVYDFRDQVVLVTGGSSGIGLASVTGFAEAGAAVVIVDVNETTLRPATEKLSAAGHQVLGLPCDVTDEQQVAAAVERTVAEFGKLDIAFNNAGVLGYTGEMADEPIETFDQVSAVNLRGVWACMKYELLQMRRQGNGVIVNTSSLGGLVGLPNRATYHAAKHGVIGLTKSVAMDYASHGIRVNAVCPGVIQTPMSEGLTQSHGEILEEILRDQPIGRLGRADEVANAVLWLSSPASSFVIGVALPVDGGFVAH